MRTYALFASILIGVAGTGYGSLIDTLSDSLYPFPGGSLPPSVPSTMSVVRLIRVSVTPAWPSPTDPVSVTITAEASSAYLVLDQKTVARQGGDVVIDLYWSDHTPPTTGGAIELFACGLGYGIEQIHLTPSAIRADKTYETTEPLGTFSPGMHTVRVHSHGALEGEASALFRVRDPAPLTGSIFDLFNNLH